MISSHELRPTTLESFCLAFKIRFSFISTLLREARLATLARNSSISRRRTHPFHVELGASHHAERD